jgi:hypothetical protein
MGRGDSDEAYVLALCDEVLGEQGMRALTHEDVEAHNAGEDEHTVRWLTGGYGTVESTTIHFDKLADNARAGCGKRGFGVCLDVVSPAGMGSPLKPCVLCANTCASTGSERGLPSGSIRTTMRPSV